MADIKLKHLELLDHAKTKVAEAKALAEKADTEKREMTTQEADAYKAAYAEAEDYLAKAKTAKHDYLIESQVSDFAKSIDSAEGQDIAERAKAGDLGARNIVKARNWGQIAVESEQYKAAIKSFMKDGRIPDRAPFSTAPISVPTLGKSLFTGASDTSGGAFVVADQSGIVEMLGRRPLTIRDLISVRTTGSDAVEYVRQTSHTNAAATVAEATSSAFSTAPGSAGALVPVSGGGYKPEGAWAFLRVSTTVKTIAEWVPATKRALADVGQLEGLIRDELQADLAEVEESQILNGDASGENFDGITHVSGTQAQAFSVDMFTTIRKAITKARTIGRVIPNAVVMNPTDVETLDLARDDSGASAGTGGYLGGGPWRMAPRTLWGVPVVESEAQTQGFAIVGDFSKAVLWDREQSTVTMTDSHLDFFTRNLVAILAEERAAFGVTRPTAFVIADVVA